MSTNCYRPHFFLSGLQQLPPAFTAYCFVPPATILHTIAEISPLLCKWLLLTCRKKKPNPHNGLQHRTRYVPGATPVSQSHSIGFRAFLLCLVKRHIRFLSCCFESSSCNWLLLIHPCCFLRPSYHLSATSSDRLFLTTWGRKQSFLVTLYQILLFISSIVLITAWNIDFLLSDICHSLWNIRSMKADILLSSFCMMLNTE